MGDSHDPPADDPIGAPPPAEFTLDSSLEEVLAALEAADPVGHALARCGAWDQLESRGSLGERALAWARFHRHLPAQRRAAERLELDAAIRAHALRPELETVYLDRLAAAYEHGGDMRAVLVEATAHVQQRAPLRLVPGVGPVRASAGLLHFTVERQELSRALLTAKAVLESDDGGLGDLQIVCRDTALLRFAAAGARRRSSSFELRLLTTRCISEGALAVRGRVLQGTLRNFASGSIALIKSEGRGAIKLRQPTLELGLPTVDYVPIDLCDEDMTPAGAITLDHLRDMLTAVVHVAQAGSGAGHPAVVRFGFADGRLHLAATGRRWLVRAVGAVPGGDALAGVTLAAADADRLCRLLDAYRMYLHPGDGSSPARLRLAVRPGHSLSGETDALRFTLPHDRRDVPDDDAAIPPAVPDVAVVSFSELRSQLYRVWRPFGDATAHVRVEARADEVRLRANHPKTGQVIERALSEGLVYGRPFVRRVGVSSLLAVLANLPLASHYVLACDADDDRSPLVVLPWPGHGSQAATPNRVAEFVAFGLRVATVAVALPPDRGQEAPTSD